MTYSKFAAKKVINRENLEFSPAEYSRFKYGSRSVARKFGRELGKAVAEYLIPKLTPDIQIVISSSPYMFIPTASFALKDYIVATMNPILVKAGFKPIQETKTYRFTKYSTEYGHLPASERRKLVSSETFHIDREFIKDKFVIFVDDIVITGSHQARMEEMIDRLNLKDAFKDCLFVYYAELVDPESDASIEGYLNYYSMKGLTDLDKIIKNDEFILNTRNVKYILGAPHVECTNFLEYQKESFIHKLYHETIGNHYHNEPAFKANFQYLELMVENLNQEQYEHN